MRILIANYRYFVSSGPERYLFNVVPRLEALGHQVAPLSVRYSLNQPSDYERYFVSPLAGEDAVYFDDHKKTPATIGKTLARLFYSKEVETAAERLVADFKPDVAYVLYYLRKMSPSLLVGLKKQGVPIVVRLSDYGMFCPEHHCLRDGAPCTLCLGGDLTHSVRNKCLKGSRVVSALDAAATMFHRWRGYFNLIDAFIATNDFMRDMMVKAGFDAQRLHVAPTFTDDGAFAPPASDGGRSGLLYVGRLDKPKGVEVLLRALAALKRRGGAPPLLRLAGDAHAPGYMDELKALAVRLGIEEHTDFLGYMPPDALPNLYAAARGVVLPALWFENLPNSLLEAMASGTPPIVSDIGSLAAVISHERTGLKAPPGDPEGLADAIARLDGDDALWRRLSAGALEASRTEFSAETHLSRLLPVLQRYSGVDDPPETAPQPFAVSA
ncbi:MAG: glycosyltransferase family 4 protein [Pseudomonadota bacterium]